jgi:ribose 5-phosphate isomerase A
MAINAKQSAAKRAVQLIQNGMTVGIGTGSTSAFAIDAIGERVKQGLSIKAVASSTRSEESAKGAGISLSAFSEVEGIDLYIDGADEVDRELNLIKGGGGALLREKILAFHSKEFIVIVDSSKLVDQLGKFLLPVEVVPFAMELTGQRLEKLGCSTFIRKEASKPYITDNGNIIVDCDFKKIQSVEWLHNSINAIPGVVENGLFLKTIVSKVFVADDSGEVQVITK